MVVQLKGLVFLLAYALSLLNNRLLHRYFSIYLLQAKKVWSLQGEQMIFELMAFTEILSPLAYHRSFANPQVHVQID